MDSAISTFSLTKRYGDHAVVDQLSLHVGHGEIYGFLGLNGAGKTTTIRMLLGMIHPSDGSARIFGTPVHPDARPQVAHRLSGGDAICLSRSHRARES